MLSYLPIKKQKLTSATAGQLKDLKWAVLGFSLISVLLVTWRRSSALGREDPMGVRHEPLLCAGALLTCCLVVFRRDRYSRILLSLWSLLPALFLPTSPGW